MPYLRLVVSTEEICKQRTKTQLFGFCVNRLSRSFGMQNIRNPLSYRQGIFLFKGSRFHGNGGRFDCGCYSFPSRPDSYRKGITNTSYVYQMRNIIYNLAVLVLFIACNNASSEKVEKNNILKTEHFTIHFTELDSANVREIADSLEKNFDAIVASLQSAEMPLVQVNYYSKIEDLKEAVKEVEPNLPDFAIGLAISVSEIHMLSPNHEGLEFQYMVKNTIHEFAHCVSYKVNPNIANNPRWLWESVAQYESGQFIDPKSLQYLVDQNPPSINDLNQFTNMYMYEVGYVVSEYLVATFGESVLNELIANNGDIETTLSMNEEELTEAWFEFVKTKYEL